MCINVCVAKQHTSVGLIRGFPSPGITPGGRLGNPGGGRGGGGPIRPKPPVTCRSPGRPGGRNPGRGGGGNPKRGL